MGVFQDSRFTTPNTNLAACLGALRVPLKNVTVDGKLYSDYARVVKDAETGKTIVYWSFELETEDVDPRKVQGWWENRAKFETEFPNHPLIYMRRALEKLEWATKVWHGNVIPPIRRKARETGTPDTTFAACLLASGYELASFNPTGRLFFFDSDSTRLRDAYQNFQSSNEPIAKMRLVLEVRKLLLAELKRPDLRTQIHYKNGDPLEGGKELFLIEGSTQRDIDRLIDALYE